MSDWIKEAAEEIVIEWPRIDAEAGERAQCEQDSFAGHAVSVEEIAAIIERRWEESLTDATPVDLLAMLDQAQDEIRRLREENARLREQVADVLRDYGRLLP